MAGASHVADAGRPRSTFVIVEGHELHVTQWGAETAPAVLMWHGLARTGRDFDVVAAALADRYRLICPDQIGRGLSQWSTAPDRDYCMGTYARLAEGLVDQLGLDRFDWLGTSMGGALGMLAAATNLRGRIGRLLVNDIGPELPAAAITRIRAYAAHPPAFVRVSEFEAWIRQVYAPFGRHTDAQWRHLAATSLRRLPDGRVTAHYDPAIVRQFELYPDDYQLWSRYERLDLPVLVLRGRDSDLLTPDIAARMRTQRAPTRMIEIPACGHAPGLNTHAQLEIVAAFLRGEQV